MVMLITVFLICAYGLPFAFFAAYCLKLIVLLSNLVLNIVWELPAIRVPSVWRCVAILLISSVATAVFVVFQYDLLVIFAKQDHPQAFLIALSTFSALVVTIKIGLETSPLHAIVLTVSELFALCLITFFFVFTAIPLFLR